MLWACLRFSRLALDVVQTVAADSQSATSPFAIIEGPLQRRFIVLSDANAQKAGVRAGQPLAAARALCPRLASAPRDPIAEHQALESIAAWAYRFSAEVSIVAPDTVFLEVGASLALFGGWAALERRLRHEIAAFGFTYSLTATPTATGARVLAMHADGVAIPSPAQLLVALGGVPLLAGGFDEKTVAALHGMGFRVLGDLFRLPRAELARRIGQPALDHLDRMRGFAAESLPRYRPPARYERRLEFSFGVASHGALTFPLQRLMGELARFLIARDGGVQRFSLVLGHERGAATRIEIGLLAPQRDAAALFDLARTRLERVALPAPVHALGLYAEDLPPLCPLHRDLFDTARREALDWPTLAERLCARLGSKALQGLACAADHRPELAWSTLPVIDAKTGTAASSRVADAAAKPRPFWLLARPNVLRGAIARVLAGPERIESGWWDEGDQRRDYYIVETRLGQRAWAFVEAGLRIDSHTPTPWMLHGWFA